MSASQFDIIVIGAGPSSTAASALLSKRGFKVYVLEKQHFLHFVVGESLLPHCMEMLEEAGFTDTVRAEPSFQFKNGAAFSWGSRYTEFDFTEKFSNDSGTVYQMCRGISDKILIGGATKQGVGIRFGRGVTAFDSNGNSAHLNMETDTGESYKLTMKFILNASGYDRVLPRLLGLETPSHLPPRQACLTHIDDNTTNPKFDRSKILVTTHPQHRDVRIWLIPFGDNRCSIGVIGTPDVLTGESETVLKRFVYGCPILRRILNKAVWESDFPFRSIQGYSANVKSLHGKHFTLLDSAAELLDPVFSSGVTIALHSVKLAADLLVKRLGGGAVDWDAEFVKPLMVGMNAFRTYINGQYGFRFQNAIYASNRSPEIGRMISSILAGYARDAANPFMTKSEQHLSTLAALVGDMKVEQSGSERSVRHFRRPL